MHAIFRIALGVGLLNVNVLIQNDDVPMWSLYFYKPYLRDCHSIDVIRIETFTFENYTSDLNLPFNSLILSKQFKFPSCPLFVSTFPLDPFVIINNRNKSTTFTGLDITIVNEISKTLNLVPIYLEAPDKQNRGIVFPNGTSSGAVGMVIDGDANMTVGAYALSLERFNVMAYSRSYSQNAFVFAFKESVRLIAPLSRLMSPFTTSVWISIALLLVISILVILLSKKLPPRHRHFIIGGCMNRTPILNMINALIGNAIYIPRTKHGRSISVFNRSLFIIWILFWLVVRSAYQGSLFTFLQSQRTNSPFDTVKKIRMSNTNMYIIDTAINLIPQEFNRER